MLELYQNLFSSRNENILPRLMRSNAFLKSGFITLPPYVAMRITITNEATNATHTIIIANIMQT